MRRLSYIRILVAAAGTAALLGAGACSDSTSPPPPSPGPPDSTVPDTTVTEYTYDVINTYSHDRTAFTQGLVYVDSVFFEGTGQEGYSTLREVEVETGAVIRSHSLADTLFGEGVAVWGDTIVQLTWLDNLAIIYDKDTFNEIGRFSYPTQGWGLTHDGTRFIMSDGTDTLYFRDKDTFTEIGRVAVFDTTSSVNWLNELEYIDGYVYANRWRTNWIYIIDPETGRVRGRIDLAGLEVPRPEVANGIAYDKQNDRLFVTGKYWRHVYEIELIEKNE